MYLKSFLDTIEFVLNNLKYYLKTIFIHTNVTIFAYYEISLKIHIPTFVMKSMQV